MHQCLLGMYVQEERLSDTLRIDAFVMFMNRNVHVVRQLKLNL